LTKTEEPVFAATIGFSFLDLKTGRILRLQENNLMGSDYICREK
jgi:hypothetical protein